MTATTSSFTSFEQVFAALRTCQTPALLWYSQPGERIELSGKVLDNWVSKTANFMVDECELESGSQVDIPMGAHWRSVIIAIAALRIGAKLNFSSAEAEVLFSFDTAVVEASQAEYPVIVDRGPLSARFMGQLPSQAVDYCAEVRSYGDLYSGLELPDKHQTALTGLTYHETLAQLNQRIQNLAEDAEGFSALAPQTPESLTADFLLDVLAIIASQQGALILDPTLDWAPARLASILSDEKATQLP